MISWTLGFLASLSSWNAGLLFFPGLLATSPRGQREHSRRQTGFQKACEYSRDDKFISRVSFREAAQTLSGMKDAYIKLRGGARSIYSGQRSLAKVPRSVISVGRHSRNLGCLLNGILIRRKGAGPVISLRNTWHSSQVEGGGSEIEKRKPRSQRESAILCRAQGFLIRSDFDLSSRASQQEWFWNLTSRHFQLYPDQIPLCPMMQCLRQMDF